jgi:hypothetical protein
MCCYAEEGYITKRYFSGVEETTFYADEVTYLAEYFVALLSGKY